MLDYKQYLARHGEHGIQAIIEQVERCEGVRGNTTIPLEERWMRVMQDNAQPQCVAA